MYVKKLKPMITKAEYDQYGKNLSRVLGERSENRVNYVLNQFKKKGLIDDYVHVAKNSELDHKKIDFVVNKQDTFYLLQVKSNLSNLSSSKREFLKENNIKLVKGNQETKQLIKSLYKIVR